MANSSNFGLLVPKMFAQAVLRTAVELKVTRAEGAAAAIQMAMTLPLLPDTHFEKGLAFIRQHFQGECGSVFLKYLTKQWSNKHVSVYGVKTRTNNFAESFHSLLSRTIGMPHPSVLLFKDPLRQTDHGKTLDMLRVQMGMLPPIRTWANCWWICVRS